MHFSASGHGEGAPAAAGRPLRRAPARPYGSAPEGATPNVTDEPDHLLDINRTVPGWLL